MRVILFIMNNFNGIVYLKREGNFQADYHKWIAISKMVYSWYTRISQHEKSFRPSEGLIKQT